MSDEANIRIELYESGNTRWRAVVILPRNIQWVPCPVKGTMLESGPWVEGFGPTPDLALIAAKEQIGSAVLAIIQKAE